MFNEVIDLMRHSDYTPSWKGHRYQEKTKAAAGALLATSFRLAAYTGSPAGRSIVLIVVVIAVATLICPEADFLRPAAQFQNIQPGAIAVRRVDEPAVVDLEVVRHVAVRLNGVGIRHRDVEPHLDGALRLADVPRANTAGEGSNESQLAVKGITEVLLARVRPEARSPIAVVAAREFLARARIHPHRREDHRPLPHILLNFRSRWHGLRIFDSHIDHEAPVRRFLTLVGSRLRGEQHDVARLELDEFVIALRH